MIPTTPPPYVPTPPKKTNVAGPLLACVGLGIIAVLVVALIGATAKPKESASPTKGKSTTTVAAEIGPAVSIEAPVTEAPTTDAPTTTEAPVATTLSRSTGRSLILTVMCEQVGTDAGFGINWCTADADDPDFIELVSSGCELLDGVDPYGTATEDQILTDISTYLAIASNDGTMTIAQASTLSVQLGAILGARTEVCP